MFIIRVILSQYLQFRGHLDAYINKTSVFPLVFVINSQQQEMRIRTPSLNPH